MEILYEDNHLIAVNKKVSELVQGDKTGDITLADKVKEYIRVKYKKPGEAFIGIVHRIDRPVSGVVLFARTSKALARLNEMFREQQINKKYLALVRDRPPAEEGTLVNFLKKNEEQNRSYAYQEKVRGSREASLSYRLIGHSNRYYLLEIDLHSGRHHQIRCQLAHAGSPVKGDLKYGYSRSNEDGGISLHAWSLSFLHPVTKQMVQIKAPLPSNDIWPLFASMVK
jgi:23S rRNA pseudouridine1911/1915/1917 synthase